MTSASITSAQPRLGEFERIARFFAPLAGPGALGLLDDAALIDGPPGRQLVLTADALVAGVHFLADDPPISSPGSCSASISPTSRRRGPSRFSIS